MSNEIRTAAGRALLPAHDEGVRYSDSLDADDELQWQHWHEQMDEARAFLRDAAAAGGGDDR